MQLTLLLAALLGLCSGANLQQYYRYPVPPQGLPSSIYEQPSTAAPTNGNAITFPEDEAPVEPVEEVPVDAASGAASVETSDDPTVAEDTVAEDTGAEDTGAEETAAEDTAAEDTGADEDSSLETEIIKAILVKEIENQTDPPAVDDI